MSEKLLICKHNDGLGHCDVFGGEYCVESPCQHEELVEYAPVVHGEWIEHIDPLPWCEDDVDVYWKCSVCEAPNFAVPPYCPNCGADMRERKDNNDPT